MPYLKELSGWGLYPKLKLPYTEPNSYIDFQQLIAKANQIALRGNGRSYGDLPIIDNGLNLSTLKFNRILRIEPSSQIAIAESGVLLGDLFQSTLAYNLIPAVCPGTQLITLGGAIANDIHGKSHHIDGSFQEIVESFKIIIASGDELSCSRTNNTELFYACFGGLGLLGIITQVTIKLKKIEAPVFSQLSLGANSLSQMLDILTEYETKYSHSVAWINTSYKKDKLGKGVVSLGNYATKDQIEEHKFKVKKHGHQFAFNIPFNMPSSLLNKISLKALNIALQYKQSHAGSLGSYQSFLFPLDGINNWNRAYGKNGFTQFQFVIPEHNAHKNLSAILTYIYKSGCLPFLNVLKKFGPGKDFLSFPMQGYTLALDFKINRQYFEMASKLYPIIANMGGKVYLAKDLSLDSHNFNLMYPQKHHFIAIKNHYDPNCLFNNSLAKRIKLTQ